MAQGRQWKAAKPPAVVIEKLRQAAIKGGITRKNYYTVARMKVKQGKQPMKKWLPLPSNEVTPKVIVETTPDARVFNLKKSGSGKQQSKEEESPVRIIAQ
ncbi:hypothetical protein HAX54_039238, partial [Datura stramonium]|nr:hypothetical protein [Datura stramonium]